MAAKELWESPGGKAPAATLYSAIVREINTKGTAGRFQKTEPGQFAATGATGKVEKTTKEKPAATRSKATKGMKNQAAPKRTTKPVASDTTALDTTPAPANEPSAA